MISKLMCLFQESSRQKGCVHFKSDQSTTVQNMRYREIKESGTVCTNPRKKSVKKLLNAKKSQPLYA